MDTDRCRGGEKALTAKSTRAPSLVHFDGYL
jgi:hypothetical protein